MIPIVLFDADGVLVESGSREVPEDVRRSIFTLPEAMTFVVSGRTVKDCWRIGEQVGAKAVYGANGLEEQWRGDDIHLTTNGYAMQRLTELLGLQLPPQVYSEEGLWSAEIRLNDTSCCVLVEGGKRAILSLYPDGNETPDDLVAKMQGFVQKHQLGIDVVGPHSDGGLDCQPRGFNKTLAVDGILRRVPQAVRIFVLIDGINDLPLARDSRVFPVTFQNGDPRVKEVVQQRKGIIIQQIGYQGGCAEAVRLIPKLLS